MVSRSWKTLLLWTASIVAAFVLATVLVVTVADARSGSSAGGASEALPDVRPPPAQRTFRSEVIDGLLMTLRPLMKTEDLGTLLSNCLPNTLDTTVYYYSANTTIQLDTFIITGDINAMWLRDSTNQVLPYVPYGSEDEDLQRMLEGVIARQARSVLIDSYANAFNYNASGAGYQEDTRTPPMTPPVYEGKYEVDSLLAFLKLSYWHWRSSGDAALERFASADWISAVGRTLETLQGRGPPSRPQGMTRSLFRPSDDAVTLPYNVPGNAMACVELTHLQELLNRLALLTGGGSKDVKQMLQQAQDVAGQICGALDALMQQRGSDGASFAPLPFELDGFGGQYFMDDANVPSLLSLPMLGYIAPDSVQYNSTRSFVLSAANPYYYQGSEGSGVGGPHKGINYTWPMAVITQAMTSMDDAEVSWCLDLLVRSSAGTGLMHESFNVDDVNEAIAEAQAAVRAPVSLLAQQEAMVQ
ncbi:Six-hairpin glycosidase-like protein [Ochromonadaceae sp. CCMP2298]|nr:Six-hairpin glycosidase-like protein [Ochromonadaceae sp. CCMP2298]